MRLRLILPATLALAVLPGCGSTTRDASPTPVTITETVTETVAAPTETVTRTVTASEPSPSPPAPVADREFAGDYFTLSYPAGWRVEAAEVSKGEYLDTTIRSAAHPNVMVRVDVTPGGASDPAAFASDVEGYLRPQSGYRRLAWQATTVNGHEGFLWEFVVREHGVLLRKTDVFFVTPSGDTFAVLTQAPASAYAAALPVLESVRGSLAIVDGDPALGTDEATYDEDAYDGDSYDDDAYADDVEADFCSTHDCIDYFDEGVGSVVQCADGTWSHSGGRPGACSHHGGVG